MEAVLAEVLRFHLALGDTAYADPAEERRTSTIFQMDFLAP